ncbi:MAG TPA: dienelactone hydrolase family protein [Acidimicrobiales bacterium]|nr:dienelactone hydrolase family protein [Acidimicrobiales bacterium]
MGETIEFPSNGSTDQGYLALPDSGSGPGVVVIQEWWGLVPHIKELCDRFAAEGFVALAPDLYHGQATSEPDEAGKKMMALQLDRAARDLSGAVDVVREKGSGPGVGVVGFCMGGGLALVLAGQRPDAVKAVVPFYGGIPWDGTAPDYSAIKAGVLLQIAENDDWVTPEVAAEMAEAISKSGNTDVTVHVYDDTEHAFFNDTRPEVYDPEAAALAWRRTLAFLRSHLG